MATDKTKEIDKINVIFLCGGVGKRMFPITTDKSLLQFNGVPLIIHQINMARQAGLNKFVIVCSPGNQVQLKSVISKISNIRADFIVQKKPLGMADALLSASAKLKENPFILVGPNDIFEASIYDTLLQQYMSNNNYFSFISAMQVTSYFPGGYLISNAKHDIKGIQEKPGPGKEPSNLVNMVVHLHRKPGILLDYLSKVKSEKDDAYETALSQMMADKYKMKAVIYHKDWRAIKYPWHVLDAMDFFSNKMGKHISRTAVISDRATIDGVVHIEGNVKIMEGAVIRGPSYIGKNTVIGNNVLIRNSSIGSDCVVGYNTEIKHSYIDKGCWFHSNYIGDSVIDSDCSFGAGSITANFRLDESNIKVKIEGSQIETGHDKLGAFIGSGCRIGINASLMPGVKIGANSVIGPHICVDKDIDSDKMLTQEIKYRVLDNSIIKIKNKRTKLLRRLSS